MQLIVSTMPSSPLHSSMQWQELSLTASIGLMLFKIDRVPFREVLFKKVPFKLLSAVPLTIMMGLGLMPSSCPGLIFLCSSLFSVAGCPTPGGALHHVSLYSPRQLDCRVRESSSGTTYWSGLAMTNGRRPATRRNFGSIFLYPGTLIWKPVHKRKCVGPIKGGITDRECFRQLSLINFLSRISNMGLGGWLRFPGTYTARFSPSNLRQMRRIQQAPFIISRFDPNPSRYCGNCRHAEEI